MKLKSKELKELSQKAKKGYAQGVASIQELLDSESYDGNETRLIYSAYGNGLVSRIIANVRTSAQLKEPIKQMKESVKNLDKQIKLLVEDDTLNKSEYSYKLTYSVIQGINQALHLYVISAEEVDYAIVTEAYDFLRSTDNVYEVAEQLKKFAGAKQAWGGR